MNFDKNAKLIGKGEQAEIYYSNGYAYKVFNKNYPVEYINGEFFIQNEINKTNLNTVKYYKTNDEHILKMDYIDGITMADKIRNEKGFKNGLIEIINLQKQINKIDSLNLWNINDCYKDAIEKSTVDDKYKNIALNYLDSIKEDNYLCHLDIHPLNIMYSNDAFTIIDWCNSKNGNPIHDYASTYVILYEHAFRLSKTYLTLIQKDAEINTKDLNKAIFIAALLRYNHSKYEKLIKLLDENMNL